MPLIHIDLIEGRSPEQVRTLLDSAHQAMLDAFQVPDRDRYQVVSQHPAHEIVVQDTGLGLERSDQVVVVRVTSAKRTPEMKQKFYELLADYLQRDCGLDPQDLLVAVVENDKPDWSFGLGRAQFVTGEL